MCARWKFFYLTLASANLKIDCLVIHIFYFVLNDMRVKACRSKWPGGWNEITEYEGKKKRFRPFFLRQVNCSVIESFLMIYLLRL